MDKKEVLKQIKAGNFSLGDADEKLKADKEVVLAAVKQNKEALQHLDKAYKIRKQIGAAKRSLLYTSILLVLIN